MSSGTYVLNIQNPPSRGWSNRNNMPDPCGTSPRHINPWERWAEDAATSELTIRSTSRHESLTGIVLRGLLLTDSQSGLSTHVISPGGSGPAVTAVAVGVGSTVIVGVATGSAAAVGDGRTVGVG